MTIAPHRFGASYRPQGGQAAENCGANRATHRRYQDRMRAAGLAEQRFERQTPPIFANRVWPERVCAEMSFDALTAAPFLL